MADEAYRAVFLRVHPTGKMVLSLTTESDGEEARYAQLVAVELGVPALDVKVVPADTDRFGVGHGYNTSAVGADAGRDPERHREDPGQGDGCSPAPRSRPRRTRSRWDDGAFVSSADPAQPKTIADIALYAHGTGVAAARRRGRARRADRLQGSVRLGVDLDVDLVGDLQRPEQRRVRLHPERGLRDLRAAGHAAVVADREVERHRGLLAVQGRARRARSGRPAVAAPRSSGTRSRSPSALPCRSSS